MQQAFRKDGIHPADPPASADFSVDDMLDTPPYSLGAVAKGLRFRDAVNQLTRHHHRNCDPYRKMLDLLDYKPDQDYAPQDLPPLPVRLFKEFDLLSTARDEVIKTLTSSGTSGQQVSRIFLDRRNAALQSKVLARLIAEITGGTRLPMLIVDSPAVIKNRRLFSARGAGILGFAMLGTDLTYALNEDMALDTDAVAAFCERHAGRPTMIFGFTSIIWEHLYQALQRNKIRLPLNDAIMLHGGGWKKLSHQAVSREVFNNRMQQACGLARVVNYYGMVEQTGSIFLECSQGHLHCSNFSDVQVRRHDFSIAPMGESGALQLISLLPSSYPGHNLLTEDEGAILGEDDCPCGWQGKYFQVQGRLKSAEIRGCSDTYNT